MQLSLTGHVALVTGAAHRVGRAIALELAANGAHILVHYNSSRDNAVRDTVSAIKSHGVEAHAVQADLTDPAGVTALFEQLDTLYGRLHVLVNSASIFEKRTLMEVTLEEWERTLRINLTAPFLCTQAAVPRLRASGGGSIVNILDRGAEQPWTDYAHHGVSKAALRMLSLTAAASLGPDIRVNAVIPGPVLKPEDQSDEDWAKSGARTPLQRTGTAEDVARAVAYLCREDYLTGATIHVNGGSHLR